MIHVLVSVTYANYLQLQFICSGIYSFHNILVHFLVLYKFITSRIARSAKRQYFS